MGFEKYLSGSGRGVRGIGVSASKSLAGVSEGEPAGLAFRGFWGTLLLRMRIAG